MNRPLWRSMLYAPAHVEKYVRSAPTRGADGIILDLEDSVPPDQKAAARAGLVQAVEICAQGGADIVVRINRPDDLARVQAAEERLEPRALDRHREPPGAESEPQIRASDTHFPEGKRRISKGVTPLSRD